MSDLKQINDSRTKKESKVVSKNSTRSLVCTPGIVERVRPPMRMAQPTAIVNGKAVNILSTPVKIKTVKDINSANEFGRAVQALLASATSSATGEDGDYRYEIMEPIGQGSTATVYRAIDKSLKREVAIKRFHQPTNLITATSKYFKELQIISLLSHANIVTTYDMGSDQAGDFIVMELIHGIDLKQYLANQLMDKVTIREFAIQLLEGVCEMNSKGVLHLDIKPSNIMIANRPGGRMLVKLIDFGSSIIKGATVKQGLGVSTELKDAVYFMSPENLNHVVLDERSDIYSLGCVFYLILTGEIPFNGGTETLVITEHANNRYTPLDEIITNISEDLIKLIHQMLSYKREDRPSSAKEVLDRLLKIQL